MPQTNKALAENSPANLDRRFDRALEETFPTSDSVSVTITKGGAIDYDEHGMAISGPPITSSITVADRVAPIVVPLCYQKIVVSSARARSRSPSPVVAR
jgi:hypothetical protein